MAPVKIDPAKVREFKDAESFYTWLGKHHDKQVEIWIKIHKVDSGLKSITPKQAIDVVLCWGWIDGIRKSLDEQSFLQRYTPRRPRRSATAATPPLDTDIGSSRSATLNWFDSARIQSPFSAIGRAASTSN